MFLQCVIMLNRLNYISKTYFSKCVIYADPVNPLYIMLRVILIQCASLSDHCIGSRVILTSSPRRHSSKITVMDIRFEKMNYDRKNRTVKTLESICRMVCARSNTLRPLQEMIFFLLFERLSNVNLKRHVCTMRRLSSFRNNRLC